MRLWLLIFFLVALAGYALLAFLPLFTTIKRDVWYKLLRSIWMALTLCVIAAGVILFYLLLRV
ncbi:MAG TPA: hypothetical protein DCG33_07675 [Prevotellaceae bacterium]|nr:hypothetical protein [Prevotellaceae bacterium]